jgi:hypothetical protein
MILVREMRVVEKKGIGRQRGREGVWDLDNNLGGMIGWTTFRILIGRGILGHMIIMIRGDREG